VTIESRRYLLRKAVGIFSPKDWMVIWFMGILCVQHAFAQSSSAPVQPGARDFVEYWAAGRLFVHGGNPYSPQGLFELQKAAGWTDSVPLIMWNPPWTLLLTAPFVFFSYTSGQFLWLLFHVTLILVSVQQLWCVYGGAVTRSRTPWVLAVTYVPTIFVLIIGQISPVVLAALTGFLYFHQRKHFFAAGASAAILSVKPHLLYLFWIIFALSVWREREWRVVSGALVVGFSIAVVPLLIDPQVYSQYLALYEIKDILTPWDWLTPTLRTATRIFIGPTHVGLQFAPSLAGIAWVIFHWYRQRDHWDWREQLPCIVLVSVVTSFFAWTYDQVVFLPAIIEAAIWIRQQLSPWHSFWAARIYIFINVCHALFRIWVANELWYFWLAPAFLLNYVIFLREKKTNGVAKTL
jgi:hypothetical protein